MNFSYTFDDVLVEPNYSKITPNQVNLKQIFVKNITFDLPILGAAMDSVSSFEMAHSLASEGGCCVIHKNQPMSEIIVIIKKLKKLHPSKPIAASCGTATKLEHIDLMIESGVNIMVVDSAHGHSKNVGEVVTYIALKHPQVYLIGGNVTTKNGAEYLIKKGVDAVKVGIGPGAICTTRVVCGIGNGQISSIMNVSEVCQKYKKQLIADGGIKYSGDIFKALVAGANLVMVGSMIAGTKQAPGDIIEIEHEKYKLYRGMGSLAAMKNGSKDRYNQTDVSSIKMIPEGIEGYVKYKGDVIDVINLIRGALKNSMGYIGAKNMAEIKVLGKFNLITQAGVNKSHPHSLDKIIPTTNYKGR